MAVVGGGTAGSSTALHLAPLAGGVVRAPVHLYEATTRDAPAGRDVGVGVWSTALGPFFVGRGEAPGGGRRRGHASLSASLRRAGRWARGVGYRTPKGRWLARSTLGRGDDDDDVPGLLFLREADLLRALRDAVATEEGAVETFHASKPTCRASEVVGVVADRVDVGAGRLVFGNGSLSTDTYHLIVDATGTNSTLRARYGKGRFHDRENDPSTVEDRGYTVVRGTSPLADDEVGDDDATSSFQTWGEGGSKRFATVPTTEGRAWFATVEDDLTTAAAADVKAVVADAFGDWHDPVPALVASTPADRLVAERAVAHRFSVGPVLSLDNEAPSSRKSGARAPPSPPSSSSAALGPVLCFVGDAHMTVDPVLAQGFTVAMEDAAALARAVASCAVDDDAAPDDGFDGAPSPRDADAARLQRYYDRHEEQERRRDKSFDDDRLRAVLKEHHARHREPRLLRVLRATQLVQTLAQPSSESAWGRLSVRVLRPLLSVVPSAIKRPIFDRVLRYSLGSAAETTNRRGDGES